MRKLVALAALALTVSCDATTAVTFDAEAGTYTLLSINNDALPAPFDDDGSTVTVTAGSMVLNANGTFSYSQTSSNGTDAISGKFTKNGDTYTFDPDEVAGEGPQDNGSGVISGTTLTLTTGSSASGIDVRVYQKS